MFSLRTKQNKKIATKYGAHEYAFKREFIHNEKWGGTRFLNNMNKSKSN